MRTQEDINEAIEHCAEGTGVDIILENKGNIYFFTCNGETKFKMDSNGDVTYLLDEELLQLRKSDSTLYPNILQERLSILGCIIYKWFRAGYTKFHPLVYLDIWQYFRVDEYGYSVDYDANMVEAVMKYLVYELSNMKDIASFSNYAYLVKLKKSVSSFMKFEKEMGVSYCVGVVNALKNENVDNEALYL